MAATLTKIRTKVRRLTRSLNSTQLTDAQIDDYIDDFFLYDFPEHLRLNALHQTFSWVCDPYIDTYLTDSNASVNALVDFNQNYITLNQPIYISGRPASYFQDETTFYANWTKSNIFVNMGTGDGATTLFTHTLSTLNVMQNSVLITSLDSNNGKIAAKDVPIDAQEGLLRDVETGTNIGSIFYLTGAISIDFLTPPQNLKNIQVQYLPYTAGAPTALLYFQDKFVLRPVPDFSYTITMEVFKRPTSLGNNANAIPQLEQWWQYIAYGAAKKIFEDRSDSDSVQALMPEFKQQELLVLRRTLVQNSTQRAFTIYAQQAEDTFPNNGWWWGDYR